MVGRHSTGPWYVLPYIHQELHALKNREYIQSWITIPALIYLVAVPMWPRARRFGNIYAFAILDCLFVLLWFAAWIAVAVYAAQGKSHLGDDSDKKKKKDNPGCSSEGQCSVVTGTVIVGVIILYVRIFGLGL